MGIFKTQEDSIKEEDRASIFDRIEAQFNTLPDIPDDKPNPLCVLFTGEISTAKSGVATAYVAQLKDGECIVYVDLDAGDMDNILTYWREEYKEGKIKYFYPIVWAEDSTQQRQHKISYQDSMNEMRALGMWVNENHEKYNIKAIILDGVSKLKSYAEYQMKNDKNMDVAGDPQRKYWRIRNVDFLEILELYKIIPIDTIFIGRENFNKAPADMQAIDRDTNDLISQKVVFKMDKIGDKVVYTAKILKSRHSMENRESETIFAQVNKDPEFNGDNRICWKPENVFELLRPPVEKEEKPKRRSKKETKKQEIKKTETKKPEVTKEEPKKKTKSVFG